MASKNSMVMVGFLLLLLLSVFRSSSARSIGYTLGSDCVFVGTCKTKADCAQPCQAAGYSPTAVLCVPLGNPTPTCCCINAD